MRGAGRPVVRAMDHAHNDRELETRGVLAACARTECCARLTLNSTCSMCLGTNLGCGNEEKRARKEERNAQLYKSET